MSVLEDLPTPCVLIDEKRLEANLSQMAAKTEAVHLRPHTKTHKSTALAKRQLAHGARGITVAKVSEAEKFIQHGFDNVCIAYTIVGPSQLKRLTTLSQQAYISFCIDTKEGVHRAAQAFSQSECSANILLEIDTGYGRCGVPHDHPDVVKLAQMIRELDSLYLAGILTHEGNAYSNGQVNRTTVMSQTRDRMLDVAIRLADSGCIDPNSFEISLGSTPSVSVFEPLSKGGFQITELRPGNYIFNDLTQVSLGVCSLDTCALTVLSTVVSKHRTPQGTERLILDAGRKILTSDLVSGQSGYGCILYNPRTRTAHPHASIPELSEEHGWAEVRGGSALSIGDRVQIIPNHACVVVNMVNQMYIVHEGLVISEVNVDARGCVI